MTDSKTHRQFDADFCAEFEELLRWRRDVRHFKSDPVDPDLIAKLLELANLAPSVGLSQPWRYLNVAKTDNRNSVIRCFESCNAAALAQYEGEDAKKYAELKLAGLRDAPVHLAVFSDSGTKKGKRLGRMTMPQMLEYSTVTSIFTFWLAARAAGLGVGWVSILDPEEINSILAVPPDWAFIAYLCIGWPVEDNLDPELKRKGWEKRESFHVDLIER